MRVLQLVKAEGSDQYSSNGIFNSNLMLTEDY